MHRQCANTPRGLRKASRALVRDQGRSGGAPTVEGDARRPRPVTINPAGAAKARKEFPPGGFAGGRSPYELFQERALGPVIDAWTRNFEASPAAEPGSPVRVALTFPAPAFPPMAFYGSVVGDGVEILDFTFGEEHWETFEDPD